MALTYFILHCKGHFDFIQKVCDNNKNNGSSL